MLASVEQRNQALSDVVLRLTQTEGINGKEDDADVRWQRDGGRMDQPID